MDTDRWEGVGVERKEGKKGKDGRMGDETPILPSFRPSIKWGENPMRVVLDTNQLVSAAQDVRRQPSILPFLRNVNYFLKHAKSFDFSVSLMIPLLCF